jgi:hypothetical protein
MVSLLRVLDLKRIGQVKMLAVKAHLAQLAPRSHSCYHYSQIGDVVHISFLDKEIEIRLDQSNDHILRDIIWSWCYEWTRVEKISWWDVLAKRSRIGARLDKYPLTTRYFSIVRVGSTADLMIYTPEGSPLILDDAMADFLEQRLRWCREITNVLPGPIARVLLYHI